MTKGEIDTIRNVVRRLKCEPQIVNGVEYARESDAIRDALTSPAVKLYLETWVIPALEYILPGELRDVDLANRLSR